MSHTNYGVFERNERSPNMHQIYNPCGAFRLKPEALIGENELLYTKIKKASRL